MRISRLLAPFLLPLALPLGSCGPDATSSPLAGVRDTLADGTPRVRHPLAGVTPESTTTSLRLGSIEGDPDTSFGDVRGVEVGLDGSIWVLDAQATELRVFEPDGTLRQVAARSGGGPGELGQVNGMIRDADGTVWVNDHGHRRMIGFGPDGDEVARLPRVTPNRWGYVWSGMLDDRGRFWEEVGHSVQERQAGPPPEGLQVTPYRRFMKRLDPESGSVDSLLVATSESRAWTLQRDNGYSVFGIPFAAGVLTTVDPAGGFWVASSAEYRIARVDEAGDTVLILEGDLDPMPVTDEDREAWVRQVTGDGQRPEMAGPAREILTAAPEQRPVLQALRTDDGGLLWVQRTVPEGELPLYDVFDRSGNRLATLQLGEPVVPHIRPVIRGGAFYSVTLDELDVPYVVRIDLPAGFGSAT